MGYLLLPLLFSLALCEYQLVWEDNFEATELDPSKWAYEIDCWGGGNNEQQCYTKSSETLRVKGGKLQISPVFHPEGYQGVPVSQGCTNDRDNSCTWKRPTTSARIRTKGLRAWKYGIFEFKIRTPPGDFLWPAIWMMPENNKYGDLWASSGEIDIFEYRSQSPKETEHTLHYMPWPYNDFKGSGIVTHDFDWSEKFHIIKFEWTHEEMKWIVNDHPVHVQNLNRSWYTGIGDNPYNKSGDGNYAPFDAAFHLIINVAVGGNFFATNKYGIFNATTAAPTWGTQPNFEIEYVRVYQDDPQPEPAPVPAPTVSPNTPVPAPVPSANPLPPTPGNPVPAPVPAPSTAPVPVPAPVFVPSPSSPESGCEINTDCKTCVEHWDCVWCGSGHARCLPGGPFGPQNGDCDLGLWSAKQCHLQGPLVLTIGVAVTIALLILIIVILVKAISACTGGGCGQRGRTHVELDPLLQ